MIVASCVHFHYLATHTAWVNLIECFFSILARMRLGMRRIINLLSLFLRETLDQRLEDNQR